MNANEIKTNVLATELQSLLIMPPVMGGETAAAAILQMAIPRVRELVGKERLVADLRAELDVERKGREGAATLANVLRAQTEVDAARQLYNYAASRLERAKLSEQIASAISRGHLPADFYAKLKDWTK